MERFIIKGEAAENLNAYLEYNLIVGNKDGGNLLPENEYKKMRDDFIEENSNSTNYIVHKQSKQKKLLGIGESENEPSESIAVFHGKNPDFAGKQRGFVDIAKSEDESIYNLFNKQVGAMDGCDQSDFDKFEDVQAPPPKKAITHKPIASIQNVKSTTSSIPKSTVPKATISQIKKPVPKAISSGITKNPMEKPISAPKSQFSSEKATPSSLSKNLPKKIK